MKGQLAGMENRFEYLVLSITQSVPLWLQFPSAALLGSTCMDVR